MLIERHLALCVHPSISSAAALHAQRLSTFLPDLAQHLLQDALNGGHLFLGTLLQLKAPEIHSKQLNQLSSHFHKVVPLHLQLYALVRQKQPCESEHCTGDAGQGLQLETQGACFMCVYLTCALVRRIDDKCSA